MTKEDWTQIEKGLPAAGYAVHLNCDGYKLTIRRARRTEMRDCLVIFVNGEFRGEWPNNDCEERRRFLCPRKSFYHKPRIRSAMKANRAREPKYVRIAVEKALGKLADPDATFTWYSQIWPSFKSLKAHLVKNNKEISFRKEAEEQAAGQGAASAESDALQ